MKQKTSKEIHLEKNKEVIKKFPTFEDMLLHNTQAQRREKNMQAYKAKGKRKFFRGKNYDGNSINVIDPK